MAFVLSTFSPDNQCGHLHFLLDFLSKFNFMLPWFFLFVCCCFFALFFNLLMHSVENIAHTDCLVLPLHSNNLTVSAAWCILPDVQNNKWKCFYDFPLLHFTQQNNSNSVKLKLGVTEAADHNKCRAPSHPKHHILVVGSTGSAFLFWQWLQFGALEVDACCSTLPPCLTVKKSECLSGQTESSKLRTLVLWLLWCLTFF